MNYSIWVYMNTELINLLNCQWPLAVNWGMALDTKYMSSQIAAFITRHLWYVWIHTAGWFNFLDIVKTCCRREPWEWEPILWQGWNELSPFKEASTISIANEKGSQLAVWQFVYFEWINDKSLYSASQSVNYSDSAIFISHINNQGSYF